MIQIEVKAGATCGKPKGIHVVEQIGGNMAYDLSVGTIKVLDRDYTPAKSDEVKPIVVEVLAVVAPVVTVDSAAVKIEEPKMPDFEGMTIVELQKLVKEHNIKPASKLKADLIEALQESWPW